MKLRYPLLNELKTFHAVAEAGRFRKAAEQLSVTESAVSHQIRRLEKHLGVRLFEKRGREMRLSAAGIKYYQAVCQALADLSAATDELIGIPAKPRTTLTLPTSLAALWLIPRLARLQQRHPEVYLRIVTTNRLCDFDRENIDLGIRYGHGQWRGYHSEKILPEVVFPVASKSLLRNYRKMALPKVLREARIIVNALHPDEWEDWCVRYDFPMPTPERTILLESSELVLQAAMEGVGIAMGRRPMVDRLIDSKRLVCPCKDASIASGAYYLVSRNGVRLSKAADGSRNLVDRRSAIGFRRLNHIDQQVRPRELASAVALSREWIIIFTKAAFLD
jgi:LysR family glycine cleavage system transcriptional activator